MKKIILFLSFIVFFWNFSFWFSAYLWDWNLKTPEEYREGYIKLFWRKDQNDPNLSWWEIDTIVLNTWKKAMEHTNPKIRQHYYTRFKDFENGLKDKDLEVIENVKNFIENHERKKIIENLKNKKFYDLAKNNKDFFKNLMNSYNSMIFEEKQKIREISKNFLEKSKKEEIEKILEKIKILKEKNSLSEKNKNIINYLEYLFLEENFKK